MSENGISNLANLAPCILTIGKQLLYEYLNPDPRTVRDEEFFYEPVKFEQKSKLESNKTNIEI